MAFSGDDLFGVGATQIVVGPGNTNAKFVDAIGRQKSILVKYFSGGTLEIQAAPAGLSGIAGGSTQPGTSFVLGNGYIFGTSEAVSLEGPVRFYLLATGVTTTAMVLRGLTNPGFNGNMGE